MKVARSLSTRVLFGAIVVLVCVGGVLLWNSARSYRRGAEGLMVEKAAAFTAVADAAKDHVAKLHAGGLFQVEPLVAELREKVASGEGYEAARLYDAIPVVAGWLRPRPRPSARASTSVSRRSRPATRTTTRTRIARMGRSAPGC